MDDAELLEQFAQMSRRLGALDDVGATMTAIVEATVELVPGCDHVSLSHLAGGDLRSACSNDQIGPLLDAVQTETDEGPCLDAIRLGGTLVADDLSVDPRWPSYGPRAVEATGVVSSLATQLHDGNRVIGALNLFSEELGSFVPDPRRDALIALLAAHATPALSAALRLEHARSALESRDLIGQAKGMLMARSDVDADEAFRLLVRASQRMNVKLVEVARQIVDGTIHGTSSADA